MKTENDILKSLKNFGLDYIVDDTLLITIKKGKNKSKYQLVYLSKINNTALNHLLFIKDPILVCIKSTLDSSQSLLLKSLDVNFVDAAGNCFINTDDVYIFNFHKSSKATRTASGPSPLKSAGIKYAYHLLKDDSLLEQTLEKISETSDISLGSAANLKKSFNKSYLDTFEELDRIKLIKDFTISFNNLAKRSITLGEFHCDDLQSLIADNRVMVSGQHAVKSITGQKNIKPRHAHIYIKKKDLGSLVLDYSLDKNNKLMNVVVYRDLFNLSEKFAPLFLAYADLCESKDPRDRELATEIFNEFK